MGIEATQAEHEYVNTPYQDIIRCSLAEDDRLVFVSAAGKVDVRQPPGRWVKVHRLTNWIIRLLVRLES